jgi:hypothetical protein
MTARSTSALPASQGEFLYSLRDFPNDYLDELSAAMVNGTITVEAHEVLAAVDPRLPSDLIRRVDTRVIREKGEASQL